MKLIECPRDAWQGFHPFIPSETKLAYLNQLMKVGFETIDFGSFVSPKAMPQMQDTAWVTERLDLSGSSTSLLAIVANERGAADACTFGQIGQIGYPFSISETFQMRNTQATIAESFERVKRIAGLCTKHQKELVIYISMGFGNPYGDAWAPEIVMEWVEKLSKLGVSTFSLADTVGVAQASDIGWLFTALIPHYPELEFGAHFHTRPDDWRIKIQAAYDAGCRRFDGAMFGYGGCPMAQDDLVGNMPTERLIDFAKEQKELLSIDADELQKARTMFQQIVG
ncbi:hydroxymethylglutaryl-CoA lyase [Dyadobacter fermentans]|uniref:Pyruvate carboxyltransferase n=1 Tax=Dyadobacter fermentans (strain ATCC 700827 / DSM 18053 / CIP 107007 / KCTC 52180 / NS114) TaxID=471854 RepID=C6W225_DYAFD|nr:hydroxymethylglutaryl-CoA lyase [Dyadobacter fermentans]ACT95600.1 pyruvate carboxyltransferase [Dyadobacter fermentans DSM 18053]